MYDAAHQLKSLSAMPFFSENMKYFFVLCVVIEAISLKLPENFKLPTWDKVLQTIKSYRPLTHLKEVKFYRNFYLYPGVVESIASKSPLPPKKKVDVDWLLKNVFHYNSKVNPKNVFFYLEDQKLKAKINEKNGFSIRIADEVTTLKYPHISIKNLVDTIIMYSVLVEEMQELGYSRKQVDKIWTGSFNLKIENGNWNLRFREIDGRQVAVVISAGLALALLAFKDQIFAKKEQEVTLTTQ